MKERRKFRRIEADIDVAFKTSTSTPYISSKIINISQGGILLKSKKQFPLDEKMTIKFEKGKYNNFTFELSAKIVRCETIYDNKLYHIAVMIDRDKEDNAKKIDKFYASLLKIKKEKTKKNLS